MTDLLGMTGWGKIALWGAVLFGIVTWSSPSIADCGDDIATIGGFDKEFGTSLPLYLTVEELKTKLKTNLLAARDLDPEIRHFLNDGGDVLQIGGRKVIESMGAAYERVLNKSSLTSAKKERLLKGLRMAVAELIRGLPYETADHGDGGSGGDFGSTGGGGGGNGPNEFDRMLRNESLKRCTIRTSILFLASNLINTAGALQAKWGQYAGEETSVIDGIASRETWDNAMNDWEFKHNVMWNGIIMTSLGAATCLSNAKMGRALVGTLSAAASMAGQYFAKGKITLRQTALDVLFVQLISINKTKIVFGLSNQYAKAGYPAPHLVEGLLQLGSEGVGAYTYPRTVTFNEWLFNQ